MGCSCFIVLINTVACTLRAVQELLHTTCIGLSSDSIQHSPYTCTSLPIGYFSVIHWLNHLCSRKWFNFPSIMEQREHFHYPKPPGDFLTSEVVLARSIHHKPVGREVHQHLTKLSSISVLNSQAKSKVTLAPSPIITHSSRFFWNPLWCHFNMHKWLAA